MGASRAGDAPRAKKRPSPSVLQSAAMDIALATCARLPEPDHDEAPLLAALADRGLSALPLAWDDPAADFSRARLTVLRSTWNYPLHSDAFLHWCEHTALASRLVNPLAVVRWNVHKSYLLDLESHGVPIVPTALVPRESARTLASILDERHWSDVVIKPAISAASYRTLRATRADHARGEEHLRSLLAEGDVLVQPYLPSVEGHGERALVCIEGAVSHAVRKSPRFAGEDESVTRIDAIAAEESAVASAALRAVALATGCTETLLYARVDVAPGHDGKPVIMELELIEPSLFFPHHPPALVAFVDGLAKRL